MIFVCFGWFWVVSLVSKRLSLFCFVLWLFWVVLGCLGCFTLPFRSLVNQIVSCCLKLFSLFLFVSAQFTVASVR